MKGKMNNHTIARYLANHSFWLGNETYIYIYTWIKYLKKFTLTQEPTKFPPSTDEKKLCVIINKINRKANTKVKRKKNYHWYIEQKVPHTHRVRLIRVSKSKLTSIEQLENQGEKFKKNDVKKMSDGRYEGILC